MDFIDHKYVGLISSRLQRFTRKSANSWNFRCCICGDSKKNKSKARGWLYESHGHINFKCWNCGEGMSLGNFVKFLDPSLADEYRLEKLREKGNTHVEAVVTPIKTEPAHANVLDTLRTVEELPAEHYVKQYVLARKIPKKYHAKLLYSPKFFKLRATVKNEDYDAKHDEPRLIIPFYDEKNKLHAFQGRSFDPASNNKYITTIIDKTVPKIYGLDTVDKNKRTFVFEGPIDSMFVDNATSCAGGEMINAYATGPWTDVVAVYDNEPRSAFTVKKIANAIEAGYGVVIWPNDLWHKDVNDMVLDGVNVESVLDDCVYHGLSARMRLTDWKRSA